MLLTWLLHISGQNRNAKKHNRWDTLPFFHREMHPMHNFIQKLKDALKGETAVYAQL